MVKNPYIIIQARMNSERLPGKVMMPINGIPMIGIQIERLKWARLPIILATSTSLENDVLAEYVTQQGVKIFRGNEDNVLERFYFAAKKHGAETIIRVTGDNPLIDGCFIENELKNLKGSNSRTYFSIGRSKTFPLGLGFEIFSFNLLEEAYKKSDDKRQKEHVTPYIHQNVPGDVIIKTTNWTTNKSHYRLTADTEEDFSLIKTLVERHNVHKMSLEQIIQFLDINSDLANINQDVEQKNWND